MKKIKNNYVRPAGFIICLVGFNACNSYPDPVPFTETETEFQKPLSEKIRFTKSKELEWVHIDGGTLPATVQQTLKLDKLPSKPFMGLNKIPSDINALADEYLRLAYHGLKARDKTFHAKIETDFDRNIGLVNMVPQDIGRVLLNLVNNAFFVVNEKGKEMASGYEPSIWLQTRRTADKVEISVRDNGNGVPEKIKEKIFQPFFTTKPTGQGTGLGLSLSYDIVKAHGGELKVETKEGEGSEFVIQISIV